MAWDSPDQPWNQPVTVTYRIRDTGTARTSRPHTWWPRQISVARDLAAKRGRPMEIVVNGMRHPLGRAHPDGRFQDSDDLFRERRAAGQPD